MKLTAKSHAFLYGVIAQELLQVKPCAEDILKEAIQVYGLQRGSRMGQTAELFGDERNMRTYLAYGEWVPEPGEMEVEITQESPSAVWHVKKCPWCEEWTQKDMLDVGKLYCKYVDEELVHGYNPDLELGVGYTQTNGAPYCYFKWNGADMNPENKKKNEEIVTKAGKVKIKSWAYHMGHIYKTMGEIIEKHLGEDIRRKIYINVDKKLIKEYNEEVVELMHVGLLIDYWVTTSLKNPLLLKEFF